MGDTTARRIAFLRALNVGGHTVKMAALREIFEDMGFARVETFIASGNVVFDVAEEGGADGANATDGADVTALERRIEAELRKELGYDVATLIRTCDELVRVAAADPFRETTLNTDGAALHVTFLRAAPSAVVRETVLGLAGETDDFRIEGREVYWLREGGRISESRVGTAFTRALGSEATMRNMNTVRRMAAKFCGYQP